jgi:hypothetical protein
MIPDLKLCPIQMTWQQHTKEWLRHRKEIQTSLVIVGSVVCFIPVWIGHVHSFEYPALLSSTQESLFYKETVRFFEQKLQASHELIYF